MSGLRNGTCGFVTRGRVEGRRLLLLRAPVPALGRPYPDRTVRPLLGALLPVVSVRVQSPPRLEGHLPLAVTANIAGLSRSAFRPLGG
jgi:hypothetical protein